MSPSSKFGFSILIGLVPGCIATYGQIGRVVSPGVHVCGSGKTPGIGVQSTSSDFQDDLKVEITSQAIERE